MEPLLNSNSVAADYAEKLQEFADVLGAPGDPRDITVTITGPDGEARIIEMTAATMAWHHESTQEQIDILDRGFRGELLDDDTRDVFGT